MTIFIFFYHYLKKTNLLVYFSCRCQCLYIFFKGAEQNIYIFKYFHKKNIAGNNFGNLEDTLSNYRTRLLVLTISPPSTDSLVLSCELAHCTVMRLDFRPTDNLFFFHSILLTSHFLRSRTNKCPLQKFYFQFSCSQGVFQMSFDDAVQLCNSIFAHISQLFERKS